MRDVLAKYKEQQKTIFSIAKESLFDSNIINLNGRIQNSDDLKELYKTVKMGDFISKLDSERNIIRIKRI